MLQELADELQAETKGQYDDPNLTITLREVEALGGHGHEHRRLQEGCRAAAAVPNGVQAMSSDIEAWFRPP